MRSPSRYIRFNVASVPSEVSDEQAAIAACAIGTTLNDKPAQAAKYWTIQPAKETNLVALSA